MLIPIIRSARWRCILVGLAFVMFVMPSHPAAAADPGCRSDPIVLLSNLTTLDLSADIAADLSDVITVDYTLHLPSEVQAVLVLSTPSWPTTTERLHIYSDNIPDHYTLTVVVTTRQPGVAVTANMVRLLSKQTILAAGATSGHDQQSLTVEMP
jgi:hypothetical protein